MANGLSGRNFRKPDAALECFFSTMYTTWHAKGENEGRIVKITVESLEQHSLLNNTYSDDRKFQFFL